MKKQIILIVPAILSLFLTGCSTDKQLSDLSKKVADLESKLNTIQPAAPKGTIVAWYSKSGVAPNGWTICDGTQAGVPDLRGRFLRAGKNLTDVGIESGNPSDDTVTGSIAKTGVRTPAGFQAEGTDCRQGTATVPLPPYTTIVYIMKL